MEPTMLQCLQNGLIPPFCSSLYFIAYSQTSAESLYFIAYSGDRGSLGELGARAFVYCPVGPPFSLEGDADLCDNGARRAFVYSMSGDMYCLEGDVARFEIGPREFV
mmetsp:Transcript_27685/g.50798  ORF Transcript_27685/g.50798 Transcript_27685/m.50798 type:complete len:107 (+) Transcript_27685:1100-1420(+)